MTEEQARKHVKEIKDYYAHLTSYVSVNLFLIILNLWLTPGFFWFVFPLLGWGIGMVSHTVQVFGFVGFGGHKWEERKVRELMGQGANKEELQRLSERIENLATIITSKDWNALDPHIAEAREELAVETQNAQPAAAKKVDKERLVRLIENLEAIVTSSDFDMIDDDAELAADRHRKRESS